jgi:hypothetical protein
MKMMNAVWTITAGLCYLLVAVVTRGLWHGVQQSRHRLVAQAKLAPGWWQLPMVLWCMLLCSLPMLMVV